MSMFTNGISISLFAMLVALQYACTEAEGQTSKKANVFTEAKQRPTAVISVIGTPGLYTAPQKVTRLQ